MAMPPITRAEWKQLALFLGIIVSPVPFVGLVRLVMTIGWGV